MSASNVATMDGSSADETRQRLLAAALVIFSEVGYAAATTRVICDRARANAAAVNYHFGDKLGLYTAVLASVLCREKTQFLEKSEQALEPEAALREFVTGMVTNSVSLESGDHAASLMAHELAQPTPALQVVVERIIRPRAQILLRIVAQIIGKPADSPQARMAGHSIIAQIVHYAHSRPVLELLWPQWKLDSQARAAIIEHIVSFSLAGLGAMATVNAPTAQARGSAPAPARAPVKRRAKTRAR